MSGPNRPHVGHRFDPANVLLDPYARAIGGRETWAEPWDPADPMPFRSRVLLDDFDWVDDRQLEIPAEDLVIYEMHVRGFTRHPVIGRQVPRHLRCHPREDPLSSGARHQRHRTDAHPGV